MERELVEIQPRELKFPFEIKKQSSCSVQLVNKSNEYVAFKVKTTSPKRYCVRPNTGVILPRSTCDFTVTMQAQKTAPPDMQLKDKFLIQSTVAPYGSADEDIVSYLFSKDNGKYIEENKLRVILVSPPHSPVLQPLNGAMKQEPTKETPFVIETPRVKEAPVVKETPIIMEAPVVKETSIAKEAPVVQETPIVKEAPVERKTPTVIDAPIVKETPIVKEATYLNEILLLKEQIPLSGVRNSLSSDMKEVEDLKLKIGNLESKLNELDNAIVILKEERSSALQERDNLQQEIVLLRRRSAARVQAGFPLLFVVFMALVAAYLGYKLRS